jgi:hypothetical protein
MWMGEFVAARCHFEKSMWISMFDRPWSDWDREVGVEPFHLMGNFPLLLWILGYVAQAARFSTRALELAEQSGHPFALVAAGLDPTLTDCLRDYRGLCKKRRN